jgi:UPF0716 protein FxsA
MKKFSYALTAFLLLEIAGFIIVGKLIGVFLTLLIIVLTTALGWMKLRNEGLRGAYQQMNMMQGARTIDPAKMPNMLVLLAGILLIIPGLITDCLGLILLLPWARSGLQRYGERRGVIPASPQPHGKASNDPQILEGEFERKDDGDQP